jgi:membrane protease subunit HflK
LLLIVLKFFLAWISGSLALKAGAWHSFSDIFVSGIVLTGLMLSRSEDVKLTKGVSRIENWVSILVAFFIFYVGYDIFKDVIQQSERPLLQVPAVIAGSVLTIAVSYFMARYKIYVGRETNSPSLIADGYHSKMDMYSSVIVVIGLLGYQAGLRNTDKFAAVIIVLLIGWAGIEILMGSLRALRSGGMIDGVHRYHLPERLSGMLPRLRKVGIPLAIAVYVSTGFYYVNWDEVGIEKVFGKPVNINVSPGLHYQIPWPVSRVEKVKTSKIRTVKSDAALTLSGDENLIEVGVSLDYAVKNAFDYVFRASEPDILVRLAMESAVRQVVSQEPVDFVLTEGKSKVRDLVMRLSQEILDKTQSGIHVVNVQLLRLAPPEDVMAAFRDVASAKEDKATYLSEAYAFENEVIPMSRGQAAEMVAKAQGERDEKVNRSQGEAGAFMKRLAAYQQDKNITEDRMYIETLEKTLARVEKIVVDSRIKIETTDFWNLKDGLPAKVLKEGKAK